MVTGTKEHWLLFYVGLGRRLAVSPPVPALRRPAALLGLPSASLSWEKFIAFVCWSVTLTTLMRIFVQLLQAHVSLIYNLIDPEEEGVTAQAAMHIEVFYHRLNAHLPWAFWNAVENTRLLHRRRWGCAREAAPAWLWRWATGQQSAIGLAAVHVNASTCRQRAPTRPARVGCPPATPARCCGTRRMRAGGARPRRGAAARTSSVKPKPHMRPRRDGVEDGME